METRMKMEIRKIVEGERDIDKYPVVETIEAETEEAAFAEADRKGYGNEFYFWWMVPEAEA
jgi:hypothetical protein